MRPSNSLHAVFKRSSYYKPDYTQSAALIRARRPYLFRNTITGISIMSFAIGVFAFTLRAVGQDDFGDVVVPEAPKGSEASSGSVGIGARGVLDGGAAAAGGRS